MSDVEVLLTLAGAVITVWLSLLVAGLIWLGRRTFGRVRAEIDVVVTAGRIRSKQALLEGVGAGLTVSWIAAATLIAVPFLLILAPIVLAVAGLEVAAHIVTVSH